MFCLLTLATAEAQTLPKQGLVKPPWITVLPERTGRVYGMGLAAVTGSEAQALQQAQSSARVEVLTRLRADVKGETHVQSSLSYGQQSGGPATGSTSRSISQDARIQTQATELPGLVAEETWLDPDTRTMYALAYLDIAAAQTELRIRFEASLKDLAREAPVAADARERLRKLQRMKKLQTELLTLDDLAGLLSAGGGDPLLRAGIRDQRLQVDRQLDALRASLAFCLQGDQAFEAGGGLASLVRTVVLRQGFGWSETRGEFVLILRKLPWEHRTVEGLVVARGVAEITLADHEGHAFESTTLDAKGVGGSELMADRALMKDFRTKLELELRQWLEELVR